MTYVTKYWNRNGGYNTSKTKIMEWNEFPILFYIKNMIELVTNDTYTCCVIQRYPNGKHGINRHQDKEMIKGTTIAGVSFGETRTLEITDYYKNNILNLTLNSGSLYIMHPPTNSYYL